MCRIVMKVCWLLLCGKRPLVWILNTCAALDGMDDIACRYFSPVESAAYLSVADSEKPDTFFNCWTRKEAFIKAVGEGLSFPLDEFEVSLLARRPGTTAQGAGQRTRGGALVDAFV